MTNFEPRQFGRSLSNLHLTNRKKSQSPKKKKAAEKSEYLDQILNYLLQHEKKFVILKKTIQTQINAQMRSVLVDWLCLVANTLKLRKETIFLTCHIIDNYLSEQNVEMNQLQLLGITAIFIACKQEEIYPPSAKDLCYVTKKAYNHQQVIELESKIILFLNFQLNYPNPLIFLDIFQESIQIDQKVLFMSQYLLELTLIDQRFRQYMPSVLASASIFLSLKLFSNSRLYKKNKIKLFYEEKQLHQCAKDLCILIFNAEKQKQQSIRQKFSQDKYLNVSSLKVQLI